MQVVKSLQASALTSTLQYNHKHFFVASALWPFYLDSGEAASEQIMWQAVGEQLGANTLLDEAVNKDCAEFLVFGDAISPDGKKVPRLDVEVQCAGIVKNITVYGDRYWNGAGAFAMPSEPLPFDSMPLGYTKAFGGKDHEYNKDGLGEGLSTLHDAELHWLANLEDPKSPVTNKSKSYQPVGFAPISLEWPQRQKLIGTYDDNYLQNHMPGLAPDIDWSYFNVAPEDQRLQGYLRGNEAFSFRNMHKDMAVIEGRLPNVLGRCFIYQKKSLEALSMDPESDPRLEFEKHKFLDDPDGEFKEVALKLDTVLFFPNANLGIVVHRGSSEILHPQGLDITGLLIAHQGLDETKKDAQYYHSEFINRTHPQDAFKYALNSSPLIPVGVTCGFQQVIQSIDESQPGAENMERFAGSQEQMAKEKQEEAIKQQVDFLQSEGKDDEVTKLKEALAVDYTKMELPPEVKKIKDIADKILPGAADGEVNIKNLDLSKLNLKAMDELSDELEKQAKNKKDQAFAQIKSQIAELKKYSSYAPGSAESIEKLEKMLEEMELPPVLPRPDFSEMEKQQEQLEQAKKMLQEAQEQESSGLPIALTSGQLTQSKELEAYLDELDLKSIIEDAKERAEDSYRKGAHFIEEGRSPHAGQEEDIAKSFINVLHANQELKNQDLAFCHLKGQHVTQQTISHGFAEYSRWTDFIFKECNLVNMIFAHTMMSGVIFEKSDLSGVNLGSGRFEDCTFKEVSLADATFAKSTFKGCHFENCQFDERQDAWLEVTIEQCTFINCDLSKINFIELELPQTRFENCNLSEANFIKPNLCQSQFKGCNLSKTNFIVAMLSRAGFIECELNNTRFVGGCNLAAAKFTKSQIHMSNLRDCQLQQSDFTHADISGSDFGNSCIVHSNFYRTKGHQTQFIDSQLSHCNFQEADMMEANMMQTDLKGSRFKDANLFGVSFLNTTLGDTDFTGAYLKNTLLHDWRPLVD